MREKKEKTEAKNDPADDTLSIPETAAVAEEASQKKEPQQKSGVIKVALPDDVSQMVSAAIKTLRDRGQEIKAEELLRGLFLSITKENVDRLVLEHTPDEYYLEEARKLPELNAVLIRHAKKALLQVERPMKRRIRRVELTGDEPGACSAGDLKNCLEVKL